MNLTVKAVIGVCVSAIVVGILLVFLTGEGAGGFFSLFQEVRTERFLPEDGVYQDNAGMDYMEARKAPVIETKDQKVKIRQEYPAAGFVERVTDADGEDITDRLRAEGAQLDEAGAFQAAEPGVYAITYTVTDRHGVKAQRKIRVAAEP